MFGYLCRAPADVCVVFVREDASSSSKFDVNVADSRRACGLSVVSATRGSKNCSKTAVFFLCRERDAILRRFVPSPPEVDDNHREETPRFCRRRPEQSPEQCCWPSSALSAAAILAVFLLFFD